MKTPFLTEKDLLEKLQKKNCKVSLLLEKALRQAKKTHQNQPRDDGSSYLKQHIYPVVADLVDVCADKQCPEVLLIAAVLHDVLEDDEDMSDEKFTAEFGREIYNLVKPLTKVRNENVPSLTEDEKRKINARMLKEIARSSQFTKLVKFADRANNLASMRSTRDVNKAKFKRYIAETKELYLPFAQKESSYYYTKLKEILDSYEPTIPQAVLGPPRCPRPRWRLPA